ncbi:hypothetical protein BVG16_16375 [Paenibacillus selenitireducens]|uniref:Rho termination factor N-terminal domain-containing protein n=1 Tax=Paenibacillus selenitireducens TaxID=1324314 RepID=A0A1T2XAL9_9BACL|nr:hypothetical protein [Paenibacillus selenitireducens]OPA76746.1 hypothetical protein BVG16_16375 [Paenibacillus selenitireducens]
MIKVIQGVYGFRDGAVLRPKTINDEPFELSPLEEQRLVARGVAEYVQVHTDGSTSAVVGIPKYDAEMKADELRAIGKLCGLSFKAGTSKVEMVAAIDAFLAEQDKVESSTVGTHAEPGDDNEELPSFNPAEAVQ